MPMKKKKMDVMEKGLKAQYIDNEQLLEQAYAIREEVFVVEQQVAREDEYDEYEKESHHFMAFDGDYPCGAARWRITNDGVKLERFAVRKSYRGRGVGSLLVQAVLEHIHRHPVASGKKMYLNAQISALPLYEKFGFKPDGARFMECNIEHQKMIK